MSSILFVLELAAFLLVCHWAYENDRVRPSLGAKGFLKMKSEPIAAPRAAARDPKWKASAVSKQYSERVPRENPSDPKLSKPRWQRSPIRRRDR